MEKEWESSEDSHTCSTLYKHSATTRALRAEPEKPLRPAGGNDRTGDIRGGSWLRCEQGSARFQVTAKAV